MTSPVESAAAAPSPTPPPRPSPRPTPAVIGDGTYLALGDSLAVGAGATDPGRGGYVALLHGRLGHPALANLAVGGETSGSFRSEGQLAAALRLLRRADPAVTLVTLDIGGNDLLRLLGTDPCASAPDSAACRQSVAVTLAAFEENYRSSLRSLREAANRHAPDARLAVMTYFNPFSGTDAVYEAGGRLALLGRDLRIDCRAAGRDPADRGMNDTIACVARELDVRVADVHPRFEGQGLQLTHIGVEDIHANDRGYEVIADAFLDVLRRGDQ